MNNPDEVSRLQWPILDAHVMENILTNLSHELRTPLAGAKGYTTSLIRYDERLTRDERLGMLREIDVACNRLEEFITRTLHTTRLLQGLTSITRYPHDLTQLTQNAISQVESRISTGDLNAPPFQLQHDPFTEIIVQVDEQLLTGTLTHLITNARNYSTGNKDISITLRLTNKDAEWSIEDHGIGIPAEHLPHIFEPFYRVDTALTGEVRGLGLGLTMCQKVIELHGGVLYASSKLGEGSRFWFTLPLDQDQMPAQT